MKLNHKQKTRLAMRLRTTLEIERHTPIFSTRAWVVHSRAGIRKQYRGCKTLRESKGVSMSADDNLWLEV